MKRLLRDPEGNVLRMSADADGLKKLTARGWSLLEDLGKAPAASSSKASAPAKKTK